MIRVFMRHKKLVSGKYPIVLSITKNKKTKIFSLGINCEKKHWTGKKFNRRHPDYVVLNQAMFEQEKKAEEIVQEFHLRGENFSLKQFEEKFRGKAKTNVTVRKFWKEEIENLNKAGRTGTAQVHKDTLNSFFKYEKDEQLLFKDLNPSKFYDYETFLRQNGNQDSGIGIKMRTIRALYNLAMDKKIVDEKFYPFKTYKVSKLKGKSVKKALRKEEIRKIEALDIETYPHLRDAKNYFLFSYYTLGINFFDQMKLKWSNLEGNRIHYVRSKTKGRFSVEILEPVQEILDYYKSQQRDTEYVFPILLEERLTPMQIQNRRKKVLKKYNSKLKEIATIIGTKKPITSYTARHSMATNLKHNGVSTDIISQAMGHQDIRVTQAYLKEFEDEVMDNALKKLLEDPERNYTKDLLEEVIR